ncbi:MAG: hypothetical protein NTW19_10095 [Planctomycetota bacterium]|nr:hypothetical protein [Planctomycetota bacterium]
MEPQLPLCRKCGYDLTGLNDVGRCPECGNPFNSKSGKGMRSSDKEDMYYADRIFRRARTLSLVGFAALVLACGGWVQWLVQGGRAFGVAVAVGLLFLLAALTSFVYEKE